MIDSDPGMRGTRPAGWEPVEFEDLRIGDTIRQDCWESGAIVSVWTVENTIAVTRKMRICNTAGGWYWVAFDDGFYPWVRRLDPVWGTEPATGCENS